MVDFLTVEDINTTLYSNQGFYWVEIDTSKITEDADYADVEYDCFKVSRETVTGGYNYTFKIQTSNWVGLYGAYGPSQISRNWSEVKVHHNNPSCIIYFYMGPVKLSSTRFSQYQLIEKELFLNYNELQQQQTLHYYHIPSGYTGSMNFSVNQGINSINVTNMGFIGYLIVNLVKSEFGFNCNQTLCLGKVNHVALGTLTDYLPNGDMIGANTPTIKVIYKDQTITAEYDTDDYYFDLDLTTITEPSKVKFKVNVEANDVINHSETSVTLECDYDAITSFNTFKTSCENSGVQIIKLGSNLTATDKVTVNHDLLILGNDKTLDLDSNNIIISEGVNVKIHDLHFSNGDTTILQKQDSTVELTGCTFTGSTSTNYKGLGACILCDLDYDSLNVDNDFTTRLTDCTFTNNHSCILHGGELTVTGCRYHNTDLSYVDTGNPAFLYQTDGEAMITQSVFDIDYTGNNLCSSQKNIGYGQALITYGETAVINNQTINDVQNNNTIALFDLPYSNRSHVYCKYYYPQISACVYSSPRLNYEDKCVAWAVSGIDWIFKTNLQVTRDNPNEIRKITWG